MSYKRFNNQQDFETWLESREPLANARFGADFPVKDEHVKAIVAASGDKLISLYLGDSDTGERPTRRRRRRRRLEVAHLRCLT